MVYMHQTNEMQLFPHIKGVVDQYKHKIPKDDLKRFAKEVRAQCLSFHSPFI